MRAGSRMQAAVEILDGMARTHRPAGLALSDWGRTHRFAGSGDRAAIATLVYDVLRRRNSLAAQMGEESSRALVIAAAPAALALPVEAMIAAAGESTHAIPALTASELAGLRLGPATDAPPHVQGDFPEWLTASLARVFGDRIVDEGRALAARAPIDLRANTLKVTRFRVLRALARLGAASTTYSHFGVRIPPPGGAAKAPNVESEAAHGKGWFEIQDEGSQIAALLSGAAPRCQVLDLCAGAGGKTLAMAAQMQNTGQIYAYDSERLQLRPIFERLKRAGVRNAQVLDAGNEPALLGLGPRFDIVFADVPCTGTGTWRRRPDAKWKLRPANIDDRVAEQRAVLALAAKLVKPGGNLVYVTCSVLAEENVDQVAWFLATHAGFGIVPFAESWKACVADAPPPASADGHNGTLLLTPYSHATDGFFVAILKAPP